MEMLYQITLTDREKIELFESLLQVKDATQLAWVFPAIEAQ